MSKYTNRRLAFLVMATCCALIAACAAPVSEKALLAPIPTERPLLQAEITENNLLASLVENNKVENTGNAGQNFVAKAHTSNNTKFSSRTFGVKGSPRVTNLKRVRKGGGRYQVGKPYTIRGKRYVPRENPNYRAVGLASWYGPNFHGRLTANGEIYDQYSLSAAHPTLPLPSYAKVTNLENGASAIVRVNDRGPFSRNRIIDLSSRAAQLLGYTHQGVAKVKVEYVGKARLDGLDEDYLVASYDPGQLDPNSIPPNPARQIIVAQNSTQLNASPSSLQAFEAPVPQTRSSAIGGGNSADIPANPRPESLITGYMSDETADKLSLFSQFDQPATLSRMVVNYPDEAQRSVDLVDALSAYGPVTEIFDETGVPKLMLTFSEENRTEIGRILGAAGATYQTQ